MRALLGTALREPLLHFLLIGALLFGLERALHCGSGEPERIVVDEGVRAEIADAFAHDHGRPPGEEELAEGIDAWIDREILAREGIARGLDRDDPGVRARIASNMAYVIAAQVVIAPPAEDELREFFEAHRERWARGELLDFTHVFVGGDDAAAEARARELLDRIRAGASPDGLGDTFAGGRRYRRRRIEDLARTFGDDFVRDLDRQPEGAWELRRSRFGWHVVRIDRRSAAQAADFESAREDAEREWIAARRAEEIERAMSELRARWEIVSE